MVDEMRPSLMQQNGRDVLIERLIKFVSCGDIVNNAHGSSNRTMMILDEESYFPHLQFLTDHLFWEVLVGKPSLPKYRFPFRQHISCITVGNSKMAKNISLGWI